MSNIETYGTIHYEPINKTNKHNEQSNWKRIAMVLIGGDIEAYYRWFIERRYNLVLNKTVRGPHISFINDHIKDINEGNGTEEERQALWKQSKKRWDGKRVKIVLSTDVRSDGKHWWLVMPEEERNLLHDIRNEIGLGRPHWGLHMSIGYANERNVEHSRYILRQINNGLVM
jgi:hypothetical protein